MSRSSEPTTEPSGWARVQEIGQVLRPIWLNAILVIGAAVLLQVAQAVDVLVDVADGGFVSWTHFSLLTAVVILALCGWYCARVLLSVRYWFTPEDRPSFARWRLWVPRSLALLPPLGVAAAYLRSCLLPFDSGDRAVSDTVDRIGFGLFYLAVAAVLLLLLKVRRQRFLGNRPLGSPDEEMSRVARYVVAGFLALSFLLLVLFLISKVTVPQGLGPLAIALYAIASWSSFGSLVLVYSSYRKRWPPLLLAALLLAALFSLYNDNHDIGQGSAAETPWQRPTVEERFGDWLKMRSEAWNRRFEDPEPPPYPVVLVSAEGGGIRAAYWTAAVLGKLEDEIPGFGCHVFALSGVSGGSLGIAVYAALVADRLQADGTVCPEDAEDAGGGNEFRRAATEVLEHDFLAPALAGMLFPDFVQRFLPVSLLPDRAEYLERSWEEGWRRRGHGSGSDRFRADFRDLWNGKEPGQVPSLFFNATWVRGGRLVASNLRLVGDDQNPDESPFIEVDDVVEILGRPLRLSTAVGLSARFPYVSPVASLRVDGERRGIVDGGYFENSGALTAAEILAALAPRPDASALQDKPPGQEPSFLPVVLIVTNSGRGTGSPPRFLAETLSPVVTFFNTRLARGYLAEEMLESAARGKFPAVDFRLTEELRDIKVPLGWVLSRRTRRVIDDELDGLDADRIDQIRGCLDYGKCKSLIAG